MLISKTIITNKTKYFQVEHLNLLTCTHFLDTLIGQVLRQNRELKFIIEQRVKIVVYFNL